MTLLTQDTFNDAWRRAKCTAFDLWNNSTAKSVVRFPLFGREVAIYANANFSIYSAQRCNASCPFCVEELRPASRGLSLAVQKPVETDDDRYFAALQICLDALRPLGPTISITGGEPSKDFRLPRILKVARQFSSPRRTLTTNGSGLLDMREGQRVIDHLANAALDHLNISIAHPDHTANARIMGLRNGLNHTELAQVVRIAACAGLRVRLSCVLLAEGIHDLPGILSYLDFARRLGVDNVIFRQLMKSDVQTHTPNSVIRFSDQQRVFLEPLLNQISDDSRFHFVRQVMGYYYYVEVWHHAGMDVVFEEADLAQLEQAKRRLPDIIHELIFHPNASLASTWQPWDGVLGPSLASSWGEERSGTSRLTAPT